MFILHIGISHLTRCACQNWGCPLETIGSWTRAMLLNLWGWAVRSSESWSKHSGQVHGECIGSRWLGCGNLLHMPLHSQMTWQDIATFGSREQDVIQRIGETFIWKILMVSSRGFQVIWCHSYLFCQMLSSKETLNARNDPPWNFQHRMGGHVPGINHHSVPGNGLPKKWPWVLSFCRGHFCILEGLILYTCFIIFP